MSKLDTNWSTPIALEKATTMFQAHPDINVIFCQYTSITHGAIAALETKGLAGKVKVYEVGATKWSVAELKKVRLPAPAQPIPSLTARPESRPSPKSLPVRKSRKSSSMTLGR